MSGEKKEELSGSVEKLVGLATSQPIEIDLSQQNRGGRVTFHLSSYFESGDDQPQSSVLVYSTEGESDEEPYTRRCKATEESTKLDLGWIQNPGFVRIENLVPASLPVNPTPEEEEEHKRRCLVLSGGWLVPPGMFFVAAHGDLQAVKIYALEGEVPYRITVYPAVS